MYIKHLNVKPQQLKNQDNSTILAKNFSKI